MSDPAEVAIPVLGGLSIGALAMRLFSGSVGRNVKALDTTIEKLGETIAGLTAEIQKLREAHIGLAKDVGALQEEHRAAVDLQLSRKRGSK